MAKFIINGRKKLEGIVKISGAKNAALPIIAGSLLTNEKVILNNIPSLKDVKMMSELTQSVGTKLTYKNNTMDLRSNKLKEKKIPVSLAGQIRTSMLIIGPLLHQCGNVRIPLPGGCAIGTRKIDIHIAGLIALGAKFNIKNGFIIGKTNGLYGADISLIFPSVGATENIMITACIADGTSVIKNAAKEPEIVDLANFLNSMGADIKGAGSRTISINGVKNLHGTNYSILPDRIETGTYMTAAAITRGEIIIKKAEINHLKSVVTTFHKIGCKIKETTEGVEFYPPDEIQPTHIITETYPGFPTDMQPVITPLLVLANGISTIKEKIYDNRFTHIPGLKNMGGNIEIQGDTAIVTGVKMLNGKKVVAPDIRGGAALLLAGLAANGKTEIKNVCQIERGYENIWQKLNKIGADIKYLNDSKSVVL